MGEIMKQQTLIVSALAIFALFVLSACGGGGGGTATTGAGAAPAKAALTLPKKARPVTPNPTKGQPVKSALGGVQAALKALRSPALRAAYLAPANSDYAKDVSYMYVDHPGGDAFAELDAIECYMDQSGAEAVMDKDMKAATFMSYVNHAACGAPSGNQPRNKQFVKMVVQATPPTNGQNETIHFWIDRTSLATQNWNGDKIRGEIVAAQGESATTPFGVWTMKFWATDATTGNPTFEGVLIADLDPATNRPRLRLYEDNTIAGTKFDTLKATVTYTGKVTGDAKTFVFWNNPQQALLSFDASNLLVGDGLNAANNQCLDRTNFTNYAMDYAVYDAATGNRVKFTGLPPEGFLFTYTDAQGVTQYDWATIWGVWGSALTNGMTINKEDPVTGTTTPLTVNVVQGVLSGEVNGAWQPVSLATQGLTFPMTLTDPATNTNYTVKVSAADQHLLELVNGPGNLVATPMSLQDANGKWFYWDAGSQQVAFYDQAGAYLAFNQPLVFNYTHTAANDLNGQAPAGNANYTLVYDGAWLSGIPWAQANAGAPWYPQVSLKAGVTLTDANGKNYVVKPLFIDQVPASNAAGCAGMTLTAAGNLTWLAMADVGAMPTYLQWANAPLAWTTKPRVVEGKVLH